MESVIAEALREQLEGLAAEGRWKDAADISRIAGRLVVDAETGCWLWPGAKWNGYGKAGLGGKQVHVHRFIYGQTRREIEGLTLDHLCRVRACANPAHLEPVSLRENVQRSWRSDAPRPNRNAEKTACPQGHPYDETNTYITKSGGRKCRTCIREAKRSERTRRFRARVYMDGTHHFLGVFDSPEAAAEAQRAFRESHGAAQSPAERTHCPRGHEYTLENTYVTRKGHRNCRECNRAACRAAHQKRKAEAA